MRAEFDEVNDPLAYHSESDIDITNMDSDSFDNILPFKIDPNKLN